MPSKGVNKVILVGNLGAAPQVRETQSNTVVTTMNIATSDSWTDKQTGQSKESTEWHRCVALQRTAEFARDYLAKGSKVYIEGKLQTRKWEDQNGQSRYTTEVLISELQILDLKKSSPNASELTQSEGMDKPQFSKPTTGIDPNTPVDDDDIPF